MIIGIGTDITDISRVQKMLEKYSERFFSKVFTQPEIDYCLGMANPAIHFAGRWAGKEAFYKALPSSIQPYCTWKSFQIVTRTGGLKPVIEIVEPTLTDALTRERIRRIHHSISHEQNGYCVAFVVLEGE